MRKLLILSLLSLFLVQCSDLFNKLDDGEKLYPVKFVAELKFGHDETPLAKSADDITADDPVFYRYLVYKNDGTPYKQKSGKGNNIDDELPLGKYFIAIVGANNGDILNAEYDVQMGNYYSDVVGYPKAFYQTFEYTVDDAGVYSFRVELERMWGEVYLKILDMDKISLDSLAVRTVGASTGFYIGKQSIFNPSETSNVYLGSVNIDSDSVIHCLTSYSTDLPVSVYLDILDNNMNTKESVLLASPKVKKGVRTTLRGYLGDINKEYPNKGFSLNFDDDWEDEVIDFTYGWADCDQNVTIGANEYANAPDGPFAIIDMNIVNDCLKIKFTASGCDGSTWIVKLIDGGDITGHDLLKRTLRLSLDDREECEAMPEKEISFNIKDLQIEGSNRIVLNVSGHEILYEY